jgi:hypothetical protein
MATIPERCWTDDAVEGRVYGSGYRAWGLWAQINVAFVLSSSLSWPSAAQDSIPAPLRDPVQRADLLTDLLRYVVGSHTTGTFDSIGGGRWGGRAQSSGDREHFENWHSPIWLTTLAQIAIRNSGTDHALAERIWEIVAHDAAVQESLPLEYLDGRADSSERHGYFTSAGGSNSHPESNAWKGGLVSLARFALRSGAAPQGPQRVEKTLWLSSSACPSDADADESWGDGEPLRNYQVGTHLSDSGAVIHHGVLHPCYSVFPLFSRLQTHEFAQHFDQPYPSEAKRREDLILSTLLSFVVGGRIMYPAGQDWPRWIYGQCYLAPVLAHQQRTCGQDLSRYLQPAVEILLREARARPPHLLGQRFEELESRHRWHYDRYEADLAYALALTAELVDRESPAATSAAPSSDTGFFEAAAQTAVTRADETLVTASARTLASPFQVLLAAPSSKDCVEWNNGGGYDVGLRDLPDLAEDRSTFESYVPLPGHGFRATIRTAIGVSPQTDGLLDLHTVVRAFTAQGSVLVVHRLTARGHAVPTHVRLHCWRFAHGQSGLERLTFETSGDRYEVVPGQAALHDLAGNRLRVGAGPTLIVPAASRLRWQIRHDLSMTDPWRGFRWTEVCLPVPVDSSRRWTPGEVVGEIAVIATFSESVTDFFHQDGAVRAFGEDVTL